MAEEQKSQPSFRLRYFGVPGRAAATRLILTIGGYSFIDEFFSFPEFGALKGGGKTRWSGLPELVVLNKDGSEKQVIGQSKAQYAYTAKISGLYPSEPLQQALVDEVMYSCDDVSTSIGFKGEKDKDKQKALREAAMAKDGVLTMWLGKFVARIEENEKRGNKNGFIVGDVLTVADIVLATSLMALGGSGYFEYIPADLLAKNCPALDKYVTMVMASNPKIAEFNTAFMARMAEYKKEDGKKDEVKEVTYPGKSLE